MPTFDGEIFLMEGVTLRRTSASGPVAQTDASDVFKVLREAQDPETVYIRDITLLLKDDVLTDQDGEEEVIADISYGGGRIQVETRNKKTQQQRNYRCIPNTDPLSGKRLDKSYKFRLILSGEK